MAQEWILLKLKWENKKITLGIEKIRGSIFFITKIFALKWNAGIIIIILLFLLVLVMWNLYVNFTSESIKYM